MVKMGNAEVPDDGERYGIIGWEQWGRLLGLQQFANSQYVGEADLPFPRGTQAKRWMSIMWMPWSGYARATNTTNFIFHRSAIGHAIGQDVNSSITYEGTRAAWWALNKMQMNACVIDGNGIVKSSLKVYGAQSKGEPQWPSLAPRCTSSPRAVPASTGTTGRSTPSPPCRPPTTSCRCSPTSCRAT